MTLIYVVAVFNELKTSVRIESLGRSSKRIEDYEFASDEVFVPMCELKALTDFLKKHIDSREDITVFLHNDILFEFYKEIGQRKMKKANIPLEWAHFLDQLKAYFYIPVIRNRSVISESVEEDFRAYLIEKGEIFDE